MVKRVLLFIFLSIPTIGCVEKVNKDPFVWIPIKVTATAYNSVPSQTSDIHPEITAWGDSLKPGMKVIAVSRDLIAKGLKYNTMVRIDEFSDTFYVKDKMHHKWRNSIDIYMDNDIKKAREWGRRKLIIKYAVLKQNLDSLQAMSEINNIE